MDTKKKAPGAEVLKTLPDEALVREPITLQAWGGISRVTCWKYCNAGIIPKPIKIGRSNYWRVGELRQALNSLSAA